MESLIRDKMVEHLEKQNLISDSQHGFLQNKSCIFLEEVTNYVDFGYPVDVLYLDFQKAFDKVLHKNLLLKIKAHGISGNQIIENKECV